MDGPLSASLVLRNQPASVVKNATTISCQIAQATQTDQLSTHKWFTVTDADGPTPVACPVAQVVEKRRRSGRSTRDELRLKTGQGAHLRFQIRCHVQHKRRLNMQAQMDAEIV